MDRLFAIQCLVRVVETGSFSAVARELQTSQSAVSKQVAALERHLGARLLHRTTRSLSLTEAGARFYEQCRGIVDTLEEAESSVRDAQRSVSGELRVAAPVAFGRLMIVPRLKHFLTAHPHLTIDLRLGDHFADLVEEGIAVAVRIGEPDSGLVSRLIGTTHRAVVASRDYLDRRGEPRTPEELRAHNCIVYTGLANPSEWSFESDGRFAVVAVAGNLRCNNSEAVRAAVLAGLGISLSPVWLFSQAIKNGEVKVLLGDHRPAPMPLHAVSPAARRLSTKVRVFIDFLAQEFALDPCVSGQGDRERSSKVLQVPAED